MAEGNKEANSPKKLNSDFKKYPDVYDRTNEGPVWNPEEIELGGRNLDLKKDYEIPTYEDPSSDTALNPEELIEPPIRRQLREYYSKAYGLLKRIGFTDEELNSPKMTYHVFNLEGVKPHKLTIEYLPKGVAHEGKRIEENTIVFFDQWDDPNRNYLKRFVKGASRSISKFESLRLSEEGSGSTKLYQHDVVSTKTVYDRKLDDGPASLIASAGEFIDKFEKVLPTDPPRTQV